MISRLRLLPLALAALASTPVLVEARPAPGRAARPVTRSSNARTRRSARGPGVAAVPTPKSHGAAAQAALQGDTLRGRVTDGRGVPVQSAAVALAGADKSALTDTAGRFEMVEVPQGTYTLTVRRIGYVAAQREVSVRGTTNVDVVLLESSAGPGPDVVILPTRLEPVTVTATRDTIEAFASPLPASSLGAEAIRRESGVSLAHAVEQLAGVRTLGTGQQVGKPVIRGLSGARVLVLDNGLRLEDYSWSDEDAPSVDARLAERVELIRGPASVLYGSDALGGVINVIPDALPVSLDGRTIGHASAEVYGATNNIELGTVLRGEGARGRNAGRVVVVGRRAEDLHTPAGEVPNTGFEAVNGEVALAHRGESGHVGVRYVRYGGEFKLLEAGGPRSEAGRPEGEEEEGGPERKVGDDRVQLTADRVFGPGLRLEGKAQWQRHDLAEMSDDAAAATGGAQREVQVFDLLLNTYTADLLAHHAAGRVAGTVGASLLAQTSATDALVPLIPDARVAGGALFAFEQLGLGPARLVAGARVDRRAVRSDADASVSRPAERRDHTAYSGDVGVVYQLVPAVAVAANVGRAWRAPTLFELFANGPRLGEARFEVGSPALRPEASLSADASLRWRAPRARGELSAFRTGVGDYIYVTPSGEFRPSAPGGTDSLRVYRYGQTDATLWGGELSAEVEAWPALVVRGRAEAVRGTRDDSDDDPLPLIPPARAMLGAEVRGQWGWAGRVRAGLDGEYVSARTRLSSLEQDAAGEGGTLGLTTSAYTLLNASAGAERELAGRLTRVDLRVRNATNRRYRDYLSRYKEFAYDPGRNVVLRVAVEF